MAGAADVRAEEDINPDTGIPKPELDVEARPVNALVRPVEAQHSAMGQLAGALKEFNPTLGALQERFANIEKVQGTAQAEEAFAKDKGNWDQAVQNGDIPSFLHPYGRLAARERFGRMAGDKMGNDIQADPQYIQENQNATTIEQHDAAWSGARQRWEAKNLGHSSHTDPMFQANFQQMATAHTQDARNKAVGEVEQNYLRLNGTHLASDITTHTESLITEGADRDTMATQITAMANDMSLPESIRRAAVSRSIDDLARKRGDISLYDLADNIKITGFDGKQYNLGSDPDFAKLRDAGRYDVARIDRTQATVANQQRLTKQQNVRSEQAANLVGAFNNEQPIDSALLVAKQAYLTAGMADKIPELEKIVANHGKGVTESHYNDLLSDVNDRSIHRGDSTYVSNAQIVSALANNYITPPQFLKLQDEIAKRDKTKGATSGRKSAVEAQDDLNKLDSHWDGILKHSFGGDILDKFDPSAALSYKDAMADFITMRQMYLKAHEAGIDPMQYEEFLEKAHDVLYNHYKSTLSPGTQGHLAQFDRKTLQKGVDAFIENIEAGEDKGAQ